MVVFIARDGSCLELSGFVPHNASIPSQTGESRGPVRQAKLVGNETDNVKTQSSLPLGLIVDAQPAETDPESYEGQYDEDVGPEGAEIGVGA